MDKTKLSLASLKDKVSNALNNKAEKKLNKDKARNNKGTSQPTKSGNSSSTEQVNTAKSQSINEDLRREALELGATEEDLELVEKLDEADDDLSEQEFDSDVKVDKSLTNELSDFMKQIGLKTHKVEDVVTDDEEEVPELVEEEEASEPSEEAESEGDAASEQEESEPEADTEVAEEEAEAEAESEAEEEEEEASVIENEKPKSKNPDKVTNLQTVISDRLSVQPRSDWYNTPVESATPDRYLKQQDIDELYEKAKKLIEEENRIYDEEFNKSSSQKRFLAQILTGGTLSDKISALTLLVQEAPLHNLRALDNLFNMCQKKSRTAAMQCVDAVVDLLVNTILPPDRKLKPFKKQPLSMTLSDEQLILMYFEDHLKNHYYQFITMLEKMSHDSILYVRMKIVSHIFALLKAKPEQEANLLRLGVNKLGDIDNKVSSKTSYQILLVEQEHPAMKQIISEGVIDVVFRSNNDHHALYYSVNTLNQTILTKHDESLANKLVDAYFALFEKLLVKTNDENNGKLKETEHQKDGRRKQKVKRGKKGGKSVKNVKDESEVVEEKNSKMFAAILTGLNRAFPFSNFPMNIFENHLNVLYKITHSLNFNTSVQALILIQTITSKFSDESHRDRFFRTLYESLWDERLLTSSKQGIYLNLVFKSLKEDNKTDRVLAFVKRIAQVCTSWLNIGTVAGMIYLLIQLEREIPEIRNLFLNTPMDDEINKRLEQEETSEETKEEAETPRVYDSKKRDPQFANADKASLWEIEFFLNHYHPTVQNYAENFVKFDELSKAERKTINKPDLGLYSLAHFLDRFVYKKAKGKANLKGSSIMQPLGGAHTGNLLVRATGVESKDIPANTEDWLSKKANQIKPEDNFFYQYFISKQEKLMNSKIDKELDARAKNDEDDEDSELDDDTVWNALVASNPEVEGDGDDADVDLDEELSDLDMSDFSDDSEEEVAAVADVDDSDSEAEGLVRLRTVEDMVESGDEEDDEEVLNTEQGNISSDGEDVNVLLEEDEDDVYGSDDDDDEEVEVPSKSSKKSGKRGHGDEEENGKKSKRTKFSSLPTFASAEDYAEYLESSDDE
jgi:ribosome biogenesis protein MAK21